MEYDVLNVTAGFLFFSGVFLTLQDDVHQKYAGIAYISSATLLWLFMPVLDSAVLAPIILDGVPHSRYADPTLQALILTAIVIGLGILAFASVLGLLFREMFTHFGRRRED